MSNLSEQIDALLALNAKGAVSHPVPGLAVELLEKASIALRTTADTEQDGKGVKVKGLDIADTCDGVEQDAFEAWASGEKYDMHEHPMHYLFLDPKTDAARMGWKAGITHARQRILSTLSNAPQQEASWFAVQSVAGAHIGMWQDERIARRVFDEEYPDGSFIRLYASPPPASPAPSQDGAVTELPDDIRVPLHSLQADVDYLFGRVAADGSCAGAIAASVRERLAALEAALNRGGE